MIREALLWLWNYFLKPALKFTAVLIAEAVAGRILEQGQQRRNLPPDSK